MDTIICGDCLEVMPTLEDKSVNLAILDLPYNIKKATWDSIPEYMTFVGSVFKECERVLKDNGSLYWFHNDFNTIVDVYTWLRDNSRFVFRQLITWDKSAGATNGFAMQRLSNGTMRNYYDGFTEYICYFVRRESMKTEWDKTGLQRVMRGQGVNNFTSLRDYFKWFQSQLGMTLKEITDRLGRRAEHCFYWGSTQWEMLTEETYVDLCALLDDQIERRDYKDLRAEYEDLRRDYEDLRYNFNVQNVLALPYGNSNVWMFSVDSDRTHITQKPVRLIENIIEHSTNEGDTVLDPTCGSGTTAVACKRSDRHYICIEKEQEYCAIAEKRLKEML